MHPHRPLGLAALSLAVLCACGGDDNNDNTPITVDLNGSWTFAVDVTVANGVCAGEENAPVDPFAVSFLTVDPNADGTYDVTVTGDFGDAGGSIAGTVTGVPQTGDVIVLSGDIAEDGGTTRSTYTLTVKSATRLEGTEDWSWSGTGGTCTGGKSTVVVTRT
jgi:hypothetical protein